MDRRDPLIGRVADMYRDGLDAAVIVLEGEQDIATADRLRDGLEQADESGAAVIRVDATGVTLLDSTSVGVLLFFARRLAERGAELELWYSAPAIRRMVDVSGLGRAVRVVPPPRV